MITIEKEIKQVNEKRYTNYFICTIINDKKYRVPIQIKTFGKEWTNPQVRQNFTILDMLSTTIYDVNEELADKGI